MGLLDTLSVSVDGAFSTTRYLSTAFEGNAVVRLREDNLSVEQDFRLNASNILVTDDVSEDTVGAWLTANSASNAYVVTWYDQSGNLYDFDQATAANQPLLNLTGLDGKATLESARLRSTEMRSGTYQMVSANGAFVSVVHEAIDFRSTTYCLFGDANATTWFTGYVGDATGGYRHLADSGAFIDGAIRNTGQPYQITYEFPSGADPKAVSIRRDSAADASLSLTIDSRSGAHKIFKVGSLQAPNAYVSELIFDNSQFSVADRDLVEADQATQYGITTPSGGFSPHWALAGSRSGVIGAR